MTALEDYEYAASQLSEYSRWREITGLADAMRDEYAAKVKALEAEVARLRWMLLLMAAEVKQMNARRCESCRYISNCYVFDRAVNHTQPYYGKFSCNHWEAHNE